MYLLYLKISSVLIVVIWHFQFTAYADMDTYADTYADLKYRDHVSIFSDYYAINM